MAASGLSAPTQEENERMARTFERSCGPDGFVDATEGQRLLRRTGLQENQLSNIWDLSDLDRDRRLSLREFVCAMTLAEQVRRGQSLPVDVRPEQQEAISAGVERILQNARAKTREELSSVDTGFKLPGPEPLATSQPRPGVTSETPLGQLAQVLKLVARVESGEVQRLSNEVLAERRELEQQLAQRRALEDQLREARGRLDEASAKRRESGVEAAAAQKRIAQMQDELVFVTREVNGVEEDLKALRQACGQEKELRKSPAPYNDPDEERRDVLSKVRAERDLLLKDQRAIEELREKLDEIFRQKHEAQSRQQALLEKQRQCEQDRSLMLTAIEAERAKLMSARAERLRLWKERSELEKQLQDVDQQQLLMSRQVPGRNVPVAASSRVPGSEKQQSRSKGVPHETVPAVVHGAAGPTGPWSTPKHWYVPTHKEEGLHGLQGLQAAQASGERRRDHRGIRADR